MIPVPRTSTRHWEHHGRAVAHERIDGYLPIGAYGLIGDCRSAALVGVLCRHQALRICNSTSDRLVRNAGRENMALA